MGQSAADSAKDHFWWVQLGGSTLAKMWVVRALRGSDGLRYGLLPLVRVPLSTADTRSGRNSEGKRCESQKKPRNQSPQYKGTGWWQPSVHSDVAFWCFDVGSSYHCEAEFAKCWIVHPLIGNVRPWWDRLVLPYWWDRCRNSNSTQYERNCWFT